MMKMMMTITTITVIMTNNNNYYYTGWSKKTERPTSAILMQKTITPSDRTSF